MAKKKSDPYTIPRELSKGEETFAMHCLAYQLYPEREAELFPGRKWRFDFWFRERGIAVEIEGGTSFGKSRHSRGEGFEADARKYNAAAMAGICVLRFTTKMVESGEAIDTMRRIYGASAQAPAGVMV